MVSSTIGWAYFSCWSLSFWPQTLLNWSRKSVEGLSFDYVALNLLGFSCYAAFNCALLWVPEVKAEYAASHHGEASAVKTNDVFFALHACALTAVNMAQACSAKKTSLVLTALASPWCEAAYSALISGTHSSAQLNAA